MSNAAELGAVLYESEAAWGENVETFATLRIPILNPIDTSNFKHDKIDPKAAEQTLQGGRQWILGPQHATFKIKVYLAGHGSATTGAVTVTAMETFLGVLLGNVLRTATAGGTASATGTASALTSAIAAMAPGGLFRVGAGGLTADGRGNGQAGVVSTHIATTVTSLVELDAAPINTDVIMPCVNFYLPEDPLDASAAITGMRFQILSANYRYRAHGCFCTGFVITGGNAGELPTLEADITASWWEYSAAAGAFPTAVATSLLQPAPTAAGSMFLAPVGTATRDATSKRNPRSFSIAVTLGVAPLMGINAVSQFQMIVGAIRVPSAIKVAWTEDSGAAADAPALDAFFTGTTPYHMLVTFGPVNGKSLCFYFPNLCFTGPRPVQKNVNRVNRMSIEAMAYTGTDTTSQLSQSAMRMGFS